MNRYKSDLTEEKNTKININYILDERNKEQLKHAGGEENNISDINRYEGVDNKAIKNRLKIDKMIKKKNHVTHENI
jgi:hypothetical protein